MRLRYNPYPVIHIAGILVFLLMPAAFFMSGPQDASFRDIISIPWYWFFCFFYLAVFYVIAYLLFPLLYLKKKQWLYILAIGVLGLITYRSRPFDHIISWWPAPFSASPGAKSTPPPLLPGNGRGTDVMSLFLLGVTVGLSTIVPLTKQWQYARQQYLLAQADKANAELAFLKAQVNPHFLFNTLNNIYTLAATNSEHTAESIMQLSNIMRYITSEAEEDFVLLRDEASFLENLIALHSLRLGSSIQLSFTITGRIEDQYIPPLLLSTFVENVFKHGTSNNQPAVITIRLSVEGRSIIFFCQNQLFALRVVPERQGLGIENAKKRLAHLYQGRHDLVITKQDGLYTVTLTLLS